MSLPSLLVVSSRARKVMMKITLIIKMMMMVMLILMIPIEVKSCYIFPSRLLQQLGLCSQG